MLCLIVSVYLCYRSKNIKTEIKNIEVVPSDFVHVSSKEPLKEHLLLRGEKETDKVECENYGPISDRITPGGVHIGGGYRPLSERDGYCPPVYMTDRRSGSNSRSPSREAREIHRSVSRNNSHQGSYYGGVHRASSLRSRGD